MSRSSRPKSSSVNFDAETSRIAMPRHPWRIPEERLHADVASVPSVTPDSRDRVGRYTYFVPICRCRSNPFFSSIRIMVRTAE